MSEITEINDMNFNKMVIENSMNIPILLKFWGNWCQPCKKMEPIMENISSFYDGKVKILSVNVENNQIITNKFNIRSIPSLLFFNKKKLIEKATGFLSEEQIKKLIYKNFII